MIARGTLEEWGTRSWWSSWYHQRGMGQAEVVLSLQTLRRALIGVPSKNYDNGVPDGDFARIVFLSTLPYDYYGVWLHMMTMLEYHRFPYEALPPSTI